MKYVKRIGVLTLVSLLPLVAHSKEPPTSVKSTVVLKTETSWNGKPIEYPSGKAEITGAVMEIAPGQETGWHMHPVPVLAMVLEGELEVQLRNGAVKQVKAGEAFVEVVNTLHNGRNLGAGPCKLVAFYTGTTGQKLTIQGKGP
jgi:quercetin dioxygenase-like cupin family protein